MFMIYTNDFDLSKIVILPIPLEKTTTFKQGTKWGPKRIKEVSKYLEDFSYMNKTYFSTINVFFENELELIGNIDNIFNIIENKVSFLTSKKKHIISLGGEHLITYPIVKSLKKKYDDLCVISFDAHDDARDEYEGLKYSHATVMRRIKDLGINVKYIGLRAPHKEIIEDNCKSKHIYVSIDIDVLDPSICPGTGMPEPGGLSYKELVKELKKIKNVIGFDIVEVSPPNDINDITSLTAAKILRDFGIYFFK